MNSSKEFHINKFLSLKLEEGKTNIYINGNLFRQCTLLILNIPIYEIEDFEEIKSIDEAAEKMGWSEEKQEDFVRYNEYGNTLSPEEEFLGHCSNLQVWYEHRYDTRLLHYSLSFWLLKELSEYDSIAKSVFKEELAKRYGSGCESVVNFLVEEFEIDSYLTHEDFLHAELVPEEAEILLDVESLIGRDIESKFGVDYHFISAWLSIESPRDFVIKNKHVISICMNYCMDYSNVDKFPEIVDKLSNLKHLESLFISGNELDCLPESIANLETLIYLDLSRNAFTHIPSILKKMKSLQFIDLSENKIPDNEDVAFFKNTCIQLSPQFLIFSKWATARMYRILEGIKSCNLQYLTEFVVNLYRADRIPPEEIFKRLLEYHRKKIEKKGTKLLYNNGIVSLK